MTLQVALTPETVPSDGDLGFFVPWPHDYAGKVIAALTGGPYCHVAPWYNGHWVSAEPGGVLNEEYPAQAILHTGAHCATLRPDGVSFLIGTIGHPYGYADVVQAAVDEIWSLTRPTMDFGPFVVQVPEPAFARLIQPHAFDCASLTARFLIAAGYDHMPLSYGSNPDVATPNGLFRLLPHS